MSRWVAEDGSTGPGVPGTWRLLAPALGGWAVSAGAVARPGSGPVVIGVGLVLGAATLAAGVRARRSHTGIRTPAIAGPVLLTCAFLVVVGVRVEMGERARAAPELTAAAEADSPRQLRVVVTGYPAVSGNGGTWVSAVWNSARGPTPLALWCDVPSDDLPPGNEPTDTGLQGSGLQRGGLHNIEPLGGVSGAVRSVAASEDSAGADLVCGAARWGPGTSVTLRGTVTKLDPGSASAYGVLARIHRCGCKAARFPGEVTLPISGRV